MSEPRLPVVRFVRFGVTALVIVVAAACAYFYWDYERHHPTTDDAYVQANIVGIAAQVSGPILRTHIVDNQPVRIGDRLLEIGRATDGIDGRGVVDERRAALAAALTASLTLLSEATVEADDPGLRSGKGIRLIEAVEVVALRLGGVQQALDADLESGLRAQIAPELRLLDDALGRVLDRLADSIEHGDDGVDLQPLAAAGEALDERLDAIRAAHGTRAFPAGQSVVLLALIERCKELITAVSQIGTMLAAR